MRPSTTRVPPGALLSFLLFDALAVGGFECGNVVMALFGRDRSGTDGLLILAWCAALQLTVALVAFPPTLLLARWLRPRILWPMLVLAGAAWLAFTFIDGRVYIAQGVHLYSPIAMRALTNANPDRELHLGRGLLAIIGIVFGSALTMTSFFALAAATRKPAPVRTRPQLIVAAIILGTALCGIADLRGRLLDPASPIAPALPFGQWLFGARPPPHDYVVTYPGALPAQTMTKKPNILLVAIESLRADAFTPELMPKLSRWAEAHGCLVPKRHFSSSHATELGIFSLLYGLDASRYPSFARTATRSALLTILRDNGYAIRGGSASSLRQWNDARFLIQQLDGYREPADAESWRRDAALAAWAKELPTRAPAFTFLFLDATHLDYSYPPELEIDQPVLRGDFTRYLARDSLRAHKPEIVNRYRNAVRYVDRTLGELLPTLGDGAVIVTGDHGEEFWEDGLLGHSAPRFINPRIQVPLVLCLPGEAAHDVARSSHADVLPTVLAWAGVRAPADGESLLDAKHGDVVVTAAGFPVDAGELCLIGEHEKLWLAADPSWEDRFRLVRATDLDDQPLSVAPPLEPHVGAFVHRFHRWLR